MITYADLIDTLALDKHSDERKVRLLMLQVAAYLVMLAEPDRPLPPFPADYGTLAVPERRQRFIEAMNVLGYKVTIRDEWERPAGRIGREPAKHVVTLTREDG